MRLDEIVTLNDVLKSAEYSKLLHRLSAKAGTDINLVRIKNKVLQAWKKGMKNRKHYDKLLSKVDLSLNDLIK